MRTITKILAVGAIAGGLASGSFAASVYDDNFADGVVGSQWAPYTQAPLSLSESSGHLSLLSPGGGDSANDALYLSNFRLSTAASFSMTVRYSIDAALLGLTGNGASGDKLGLVFGVGRDLPDGTDSAAIGVGIGNQSGFVGDASTVSYRVNDVTPSGLPTELLSPLSGTLEVDYDFPTDTLTLFRVGSSFTYSLPAGTVRGAEPSNWNASELIVSLGGRGSGMTAAANQIYLDDFTIVTGTVTPEPAGLAVLGLLVPLIGRRFRRPAASV